MHSIDILILVICIAGLIFFFFERIKYSNKNAYFQKEKRLVELEKEIHSIKSDNEYAENIIINMSADMDFDESFTDKLIKYRDDSSRLETLKKEYKKTALYLKYASPYINKK